MVMAINRGELTLRGFIAAHSTHGRGGPYRDAKIGEYHAMRCPCGARFTWTDADAAQSPTAFTP